MSKTAKKKTAEKHKRQQKAEARARRRDLKLRGKTGRKELERIYAYRRVQRIKRIDVEHSYVHPAPEVKAHTVKATSVAGARALASAAEAAGYAVKLVEARGTTPPRWTVNAPDSKPNPGPPVDASQYRGDLVTSIGVYGKHPTHGAFRAWWHDGRAAGAGMREVGSGHWAEATGTEIKRQLALGEPLSMREAWAEKELRRSAGRKPANV